MKSWSKISPDDSSPPFNSSHSLEISQGETGHLLAVEMNENGLKGEAETKIEVRGLNEVLAKGDSTLNSVSVDIPRGVIMGVIGPSGSGKSTLTLFLDGNDICDVDVLCLRRKVGMLFQLPVLFEGMGKKLSDNEVYKLLILADLDSSFFKKSGGELSVGQTLRVALARTLANEPEVLLLDEPTSALDPIST
ncbi:hypothetical protein K7X08_004053 [Anisodus acutangulus]|uniref:ABC transporter domain-containing protein n=1 Tax=Anisodus acutangulus TaxID=402998 RepID=A0A9Q1RJY8_9SOLA|nr:hypothetical protein K7X08_004053 [Anisodus acutangulus]